MAAERCRRVIAPRQSIYAVLIMRIYFTSRALNAKLIYNSEASSALCELLMMMIQMIKIGDGIVL